MHRIVFDHSNPGLVIVDGVGHRVSMTSWRLLIVLGSDAYKTWPATDLYEHVWGEAGLAHTSGALVAACARLRKVLPSGYLVTVRGVGYRLAPDSDTVDHINGHVLGLA